MNGNQEMGGVAWKRSRTGAIASSTAALSEVIYVGRASFRVALELEAPAPAVNTAAWFDAVEGDAHQPVILSSGLGEIAAPVSLSEPSDTDGVPILYDSEVLRAAPRRRLASRWTIGLPLAFGGFFCGILMSPLVSPTHVAHETPSEAKTAVPSRVMLAPVVAPVVAPIVAPTLPPEPAAPPVAVLTETFANRLATTGTKPGMPVQGRASAGENSGLHKMVQRRPARIASSLPAAAQTSDKWVDPWADN